MKQSLVHLPLTWYLQLKRGCYNPDLPTNYVCLNHDDLILQKREKLSKIKGILLD